MLGRVAAISCLALCASVEVGWSQTTTAPDLAVERFRIASDRGGILDVEWGEISTPRSWSVSAWFGASDNIIVVRDSQMGRVGALVGNRFGGVGQVTYSLNQRFQIGAVVPLILAQGKDDIPGTPSQQPGQGLGDVQILPKIQLLRQRDHGISLSVLPGFSLPTAGQDDLGEQSISLEPEVAVSRAMGALRFAGNLGYKMRDRRTLLNLVVNDEITFRFGASYRMMKYQKVPIEIGGSVSGHLGLESAARAGQSGLEAKAAVTFNLPWDAQIIAGGGIGLLEGYGTPDWRGVFAIRFGKSGNDRDGDSLWDRADRCEDQAEDVDGFQDDDGCPEEGSAIVQGPTETDPKENVKTEPPDPPIKTDNNGGGGAIITNSGQTGPAVVRVKAEQDPDGDGFSNFIDQCPNEPETKNYYKDYDGCPDEVPVVGQVGPRTPVKREKTAEELAEERRLAREAELNTLREIGDTDKPLDGLLGFRRNDEDGDGVSDADDYCPDAKGMGQNNGCRELPVIVIKRNELLNRIAFRDKDNTLRDRYTIILDDIADFMKRHPDLHISVEGHTDSVGERELTVRLAQSRADKVKEYLVKKGVPADRIQAVGKNFASPRASDKTAAGRSKNRRVEFFLYRKTQ